jgi:hypothetical protein
MIMEAHIGVGLYGNEGMRAVQSGDFALGEFQYLWRAHSCARKMELFEKCRTYSLLLLQKYGVHTSIIHVCLR